MNCTAGLKTSMREGSVPFHSVPTPSLVMICEKASEVNGTQNTVRCYKDLEKKTGNISKQLRCNPLHTKYSPVVSLPKVLVSELHPLQLKPSVDHPHGSSRDHVHCPFTDNNRLAVLFSSQRLLVEFLMFLTADSAKQ